MFQEISPKQKDFIQNSTATFNFAIGPVRSGKTHACNLALLKAAASDIEGRGLILGRTEDSIRANILLPCQDFLGRHFHYKAGRRKLYVTGREFDVIGASDIKAEAAIRGRTYGIILVEEMTVIPEAVFHQATYRLSKENARLIGNTNPDSPYHWLKTQYIDRQDHPDLNIKVWNFTFEDNPTLDEAYIRRIKASYQGLWYKRFVEGVWALAEGAIYDFFDEKIHVISNPPNRGYEYVVGIDYGTTNPCAFALIGYNPETFPKLWIEKEYYYDSQASYRQKTDSEYAEDLADFIEGYPITGVYVDPSAASFKAEMRKCGIQNILDADNDVLNGIRKVTEYLAGGTLKVCKNCTNAIREFTNYIWDTKSAIRGIEKPLKLYDHMMDAIRYPLYTHFQNLEYKRLTAHDIDRMRREVYGEEVNLPPFFRNTQYPEL